MANSILSSLLSKASFTITNKSTSQVVVSDLKIRKCEINWESEPQRHQLEDGSTKIDTRTIKCVRLRVEAFCPDINTLSQLQALFTNRTALYKVASKGIIIDNMMLDDEKLEQSPENISATPITISFKELLLSGGDTSVCSNPADSSLIDRGISMFDSLSSGAQDLYNTVSAGISSAASKASALI